MDEVFKALADQTRRSILDALFEYDGQTVQALCDRFPEMTRFGVMKHLAVLEAANLVVTKRVGRTKLHYLNPIPIGEIADRWISKYAQPFTRAMVGIRNDLTRHLVTSHRSADMAITKHVYQIFIKATPEQVWEAIVEPSWTRQYFHGTAFDSPPVKGEPYRTMIGGDRPAVDGVIEELDPPKRLVMTWHVLYDAAMSEEPPSRVEWILEPMGDGLTRLRLEHGDLARSPLTWANVKDGWEYVLDGLKTVLETGEALPPLTAELTPIDDAAGEWHRAQGIECNNSTWEMIEAPRTPENDEEMLRRAYASSYHWARAVRRGPANDARAAWLLAKVQLLVGQPELSLRYADRCMAICNENGLADFDLAYAHEARARALKALGKDIEAGESWEMAKAVPIADAEDQAILDADLAVAP